MIESVAFNPSEFTSAYTEVSLHELGLEIGKDGADWGEAQVALQLSRQAIGSTVTDRHLEPVEMSIPLMAMEEGETSVAEAIYRLQQVIGTLQADEYDPKWIGREFSTSGGFSGKVGYLVHSATLDGIDGRPLAHNDIAPDITLKALRSPLCYATVETESEQFSASAANHLIFELSNLLGTHPGLIRIRVTNNNVSGDWRGLIVAGECRDHPQDETAETTAALAYTPTDLSLRGGSVDAGSGVLENSSLTAGWLSILASGLRPVVRSVGTVASGEAAITPGLPSGVVAGDLLVMVAESGGAAALGEASPKLTASGWTELTTQTKGNSRLTILYKIAVGADARTTNDTGDHQLARIIAVKKGSFDSANPFNVSAGSTRSATKSISITGATTTRDDCLVIATASGSLPDATTTTEFGTPTNASLTNLTELIDNTVTAGDGGAIYAASGYKTSKGAYSATTLEAVTAADGGVISFAINPPASRHMTHRGVRQFWIRAEDTGEAAGDVEYQLRWRSLGSATWSEGPIIPSPLVDAYQLLDMGECRPERAVIGEDRWEWELLARAPGGSGKVKVKQVYPLPTEYHVVTTTPAVSQGADLQSQKSPVTVANDASVGTIAWTNPGNAVSSNNVYATAETEVNGDTVTNYLEFTELKFAIPESATIVGVVCEAERKASANSGKNNVRDSAARLVIGGAVQTLVNYASLGVWPTADAYQAYGSATDLWGNLSITPAQANASNFGFALAAVLHREATKTIASVDSGRITISYTEASDPTRVCFASRSIELRSDGVYRQHADDEVWGPLVPEGQLLQAPTEGLEERKARYIVIPTRGDLGELSDSSTNSLASKVFTRPAYLFAPEGK